MQEYISKAHIHSTGNATKALMSRSQKMTRLRLSDQDFEIVLVSYFV